MADYTRFKLRGDVKADWLNANPVLALNEPALETDTKRFKIGDGVSTYSALPYGRNTNEYASLYNVSMLFPLPSGFYTHATAIAAIPTAERIKGLIISYETASGIWYTEQYIGSDVSGWATLANWSKVPGASDFAEMEAELEQVRSDLNEKQTFKGVATPSTVPEITDDNIFYIAAEAGTYINFGNYILTDKMVVFTKISDEWVGTTINVPLKSDIDAMDNNSVIKSSRITAIKNPSLNPELPIEFNNVGAPIKVDDVNLPTPLIKAGLNYYFSKTKAGSNLEFYPIISAPNAILPTANQYVRLSYIVWNIDNPIVGVSTVAGSRVRLLLYTPSQISLIPTNANISKLADKCYKVDLLYKLPDTTINSFTIEIICETDNSIPTGRIVYIGGINIIYANDKSLSSNNELAISQANAALILARGAAKKEQVDSLSDSLTYLSSLFKLNSSIEGGNLNPVKDIVAVGTGSIYDTENLYLNNISVNKILGNHKGSNNNVECYGSLSTIKRQQYLNNSGKYAKIKWHIYSKNGVMCTATAQNRLGVLGITNIVSYSAGNLTYLQVDNQIFEVTAIWQINQSTLPASILLCSVWESVPIDFVNGDLGITGFGIWYADTLKELDDVFLQYDWIVSPYQALTTEVGDKRYALKTDIPPDLSLTNYNNVAYNQTAIAEFLQKYISKKVDLFNQINIALSGNSIFGRVDNASFTPQTAEISLTPDCNNPSETNYGYVTGHFPPNMWEKIVAFKLLECLQYKDADVKYYNHVASEIIKSGTWINRFPVSNDCLRLTTTDVQNSNMIFEFTGASFVKFIYSCYGGYSSAGRKIQVTFSDDNETTWKTPAELVLTEKYQSDVEGSGIYYLSSNYYKFGCNIWAGLDKTKTYKIKVQKIDAVGTLSVWGFETWSNPRVNMVISAEGGSTAAPQVTRWERFYSDMYDQDLVIYELPYINDLGVGMITGYKGQVSLNSTPIASPIQYDFYYATTTGTYINFENLNVLAGQYIEWYGGQWVIGNTHIDQNITNYVSNNSIVFERLRKTGVPVLTIIPHESTSFATKPYTWGYGLLLLRLLVKKYGLGCIDINRYQVINNLNAIYSDGTHLNDSGVAMYVDVIIEVLNKDNSFVSIAYPQNSNLPLKGSSTGNSVSFGFEFKKIPTVRLYNTTQVIATVNKSGFTTTGSGAFDWEAIIN